MAKLTRDAPEYYEDQEAMEAQARADADKATEVLKEHPKKRSSKIKIRTRKIPNVLKEPSNIAIGVSGSRRDKPIILDGSAKLEHFATQLDALNKEQELKLHALLIERGVDLEDPIEVMLALISLQDEAKAAIGIDQNFAPPRPRVSPSQKEIEYHEANPGVYDAFFPGIKQAVKEGWYVSPDEVEEYKRKHQQGPDYFIPGLYRKITEEYKGIRIIDELTPAQWEKVHILCQKKSPKAFWEALVERQKFTGSYKEFRKRAQLIRKKA